MKSHLKFLKTWFEHLSVELTLRVLLCRIQPEVSSSLPFLSLLSCCRYSLENKIEVQKCDLSEFTSQNTPFKQILHICYRNLQQYFTCFIVVSSHRIKVHDGLLAEIHHLKKNKTLNKSQNIYVHIFSWPLKQQIQ